MIELQGIKTRDGQTFVSGKLARSTADSMGGEVPRQTWSDWCRRLSQSGRRTDWIDVESASILLAMAYFRSKGIACYKGPLFEEAIEQGRRYWEKQIGDFCNG
jgi:hypothetical protein